MLKCSVNALTNIYLETVEKSRANNNGFETLVSLLTGIESYFIFNFLNFAYIQTHEVSEIHALVSCSKSLITWTARDAIQEARECCGGHGYLKAANLGELRNNHDPSCTYEGDNNVLGQQASNWLVRQYENGVDNPSGTAEFVNRQKFILEYNFEKLSNQYQVDSYPCT